MVKLSPTQIEDLDRVLLSLVPSDPYSGSSPKSILLTGPEGVGKRTVVREAARELGCNLIEIRCSNDLDVRMGIVEVATNQQQATDPLIILLHDLEELNPKAYREVTRLIVNRSYVDGTGKRHYLPVTDYIAGCLAVSDFSSYEITAEHWIASQFNMRVEIAVPSSQEELRILCQSMIDELQKGVVLEDTALDALVKLIGPPDWLRTLDRCIQEAITIKGHGATISPEDIRDASYREAERDTCLIEFRGHPIPAERYVQWAEQFPDEIRHLAFRILKSIAHRFYVSSRRYHEAISEIVEEACIGTRPVSFCRWQEMGSSADRVASEMRSQAGWKEQPEIDFHRPAESWPVIGKHAVPYLAIVDDFVGSGSTMIRMLGSREFSELLKRYPESEVLLLVIGGFTTGINRVYRVLRRFKTRVRLIVSSSCLFDDRDQCFHPESRAISDTRDQKDLRKFCLYCAEEIMRLKTPEIALGYKETGALVVFPGWVPNNTLPIVWHTEGNWCPLVPRSGLP